MAGNNNPLRSGDSYQTSIKPDFNAAATGTNSAAEALKASEDASINNFYANQKQQETAAQSRANVNQSEQNPNWAVDVGQPTKEQNDKYSKQPTKSLFKKRAGKGALITLIGLVLGSGGLFMLAQGAMPFTLVNRLIQEYNSIKVVMDRRSKTMMRSQLNPDQNKPITKNTFMSGEKWSMNQNMQNKFRAQGIETIFELDAAGNPTKRIAGLAMDDGNGGKISIALDGKPAPPGTYSKNLSLTEAFNNNSTFQGKYLAASKTWRGHVSGWFDSGVENVLRRIGIGSRNKTKNINSESTPDERKAAIREAASTDEVTDKGSSRQHETITQDGEGNSVTDKKSTTDSGTISRSKGAKSVMDGMASKLGMAGGVGALVAGYCTILLGVQAINAIVVADSLLQTGRVAFTVMEVIQKAQSGQDTSGAINDVATALTTPVSNDVYTANVSGNEITGFEKSETTKKSAMESGGVAALMGGPSPNTNAESQQFNVENAFTITSKWFSNTAEAASDCFGAILLGSIISLTAQVVGLLLGGVGALFAGGVVNVAANGAGLALAVFAPAIIGAITTHYMKDIASQFAGTPLGDAMILGFNHVSSKNAQAMGSMPADINTVNAFYREQQAVLAEEAEFDRMNRSPFDISSENTFLGSLVYRFMPLVGTSSISSTLSSLSSIFTSSITSILPTTSAVGETTFITSTGNCPQLNSVGVVCDPYGYPITVTDVSTIETNPADVLLNTYQQRHVKVHDEKYSNSLYKEIDGQQIPLTQLPLTDKCRGVDSGESYYFPYSIWYESQNFETTDEINEDCQRVIKTDSNFAPTIRRSTFEHTSTFVDKSCDEGGCTYFTSWSSPKTETPKLSLFIQYCAVRDSQFGVQDAQILDSFRSFDPNLPNQTANAVLGSLPILGDIQSIIDNGDAAKIIANPNKRGWITGQDCVASSSNPNWGEFKWYQRYMSDQRLLENDGTIPRSSISAFLSQYYTENPIDTSYEGTIARLSGLSKEDTIATLSTIDELTFIANYKPENLGPTPQNKENTKITFSSKELVVANAISTPVKNHYDLVYKQQKRLQYL